MQTILHFTDIEPLRELAQWYGFVDKSDMIGDRNIAVRIYTHTHTLTQTVAVGSTVQGLFGYTNNVDSNLVVEYEKDSPFPMLTEVYRNIVAPLGGFGHMAQAKIIDKKLDKVREFKRKNDPIECAAMLRNMAPVYSTKPMPQDATVIANVQGEPCAAVAVPSAGQPAAPQAPTGKGATTVPPAPAATQPNPVIAQPVPYRFTPANATKYPHYFKAVNQTHIDIYWVLDHFNTGSSALDHAVKKLLVPGGRGAKDRLTDLKEALASLNSAIEALENQQ